jgi:hypothetical protein
MVETSLPPSRTIQRTTAPEPAVDTVAPATPINLHADLTAALDAIAADLAHFRLRVELAVAPDLTVKCAPGALREIIRAIAIHAGSVASGQRMLVAGLRRPNGVALVFTYEDGGHDLAMQETALRPAQQQAALLGASLVVDVRSGIATTVTLILRDLPT